MEKQLGSFVFLGYTRGVVDLLSRSTNYLVIKFAGRLLARTQIRIALVCDFSILRWQREKTISQRCGRQLGTPNGTTVSFIFQFFSVFPLLIKTCFQQI